MIGMAVYLARQGAKTQGSFSMRREGNVMLFCRPTALRRASLGAIGFYNLAISSAIAGAVALQDYSFIYLAGIVGLGASSFFVYMSGPDNIRLDGSQRTYERTMGWPWKPKTVFGSFSGIKGVCISRQNSVLLLLKKPEFVTGSGVHLGSFSTEPAARALVEELNQLYGFPIVPYQMN